jgi:dipeptidyl aminopeptidase/acylaminoacyl peptidase
MQEADDSSKQLRSWFLREVANDPAQVIAQSPISQIAKLDVPMLLIHGKSDQTAPFEQYNAAQAALSHAGKVYESLVKAGEGHGFYKEANRAEAYSRIRDFLLKYNPPG